MSNMSYCRFQNTSKDLDDCQQALEDLINDDDTRALDRDELAAAKRLAKSCAAILNLLAETSDTPVEELLEDDRKIDEAVDFANAQPDEE